MEGSQFAKDNEMRVELLLKDFKAYGKLPDENLIFEDLMEYLEVRVRVITKNPKATFSSEEKKGISNLYDEIKAKIGKQMPM